MVNDASLLVPYCPNSCPDNIPAIENPLLFYVFELANFSVLAFFVLIAYRFKLLSPVSMWAWLLFCTAPFFFNYFFTAPQVFPDQFQYFHEVTSLKTTGESVWYIARTEFIKGGQMTVTTFAAKILGWAPIPNWMTVTSTAFANKFFALITFIWLTKYIEQHKLLIFFLLPSFIIYSSMGLRDNLIILTSIISLIHIANSRYILAAIFLAPLLWLKVQMLLFIGIYFLGKLIFSAHKSLYGLGALALLSLIIVGVTQVFLIDYLNYYRIGFAAENFVADNMTIGYAAFDRYGDPSDYEIASVFGLIGTAFYNLPYFLLMPMPWTWSNPFHIANFLDSILCMIGLGYIIIKYQAKKNQEVIFLILCMGIGMLAYALLVANVSTFARYRFELVMPYLVCIYYVAKRDMDSAKVLELK